ncbi:MAG: class I SAM-dependent methyltransferase [Deltaproteobacteria bacterium]|nr:class I SAM-dependent methyltransferase [Deltaproteobacteria bacterium]
MSEKTKEPQYQICLDCCEESGLSTLGLMTNLGWRDDPKRLVFYLSRYKFISKMISGLKNVLEVGCGDAFGTRIVLEEVGHVCAVDFDPIFVRDVNSRMDDKRRFECKVHDILKGPVTGEFDAAYAVDVIEHIHKEQENIFVANIAASLVPHGVLIIGTPSLQSQAYASPPSREGHVNCKGYVELKQLMQKYFHNVFIFSMNDEVVHTGFYPMAHYLFALCVGKKVE